MTRVRGMVVEDDEKLGRQVTDNLRGSGYDVVWAKSGTQAIDADYSGVSLVVLDLMLPGAHGFDVLKQLRRDQHHVPVLVLSARQDTSDKVRALELGADDYLTKPFWPEELLARVKARLRRPAMVEDADTFESGEIRIEFGARRVIAGGAHVDLTRVEFDLLASLARRPGAA